MMTITPETFMMLCPLIFFAGFIDSIAGGGGIIALPAYLLTGCPIHQAIATNKVSSIFGTGTSTIRFIKNDMIDFRVAVPGIIFSLIGSAIGAQLSILVDDQILKYIMFIILPVAAFVILNQNIFKSNNENTKLVLTPRLYVSITLSSFFCGMYNGFYGPGTGTFLIIAFTIFGKLNVTSANANAKIINFTSGFGSLIIYILNGQVIYALGIIAAVFNIMGHYIGSGLAIKKGAKIIKPLLILVLFMLLFKIIIDM